MVGGGVVLLSWIPAPTLAPTTMNTTTLARI
jgi:hypothetical protein